ncbi:MarR family winged helix-turn-helix transcriptional regulator [Nocardia heshunensis]
MADERESRASEVAAEVRVVVGQLVRRVREQTEESGLTKSQISTLIRLERDGARTATELARAEGIRPQSMGAIVAALEAAGMVTRSADPSDGRKSVLAITDSAREQYRTGELARQDWLTRAMNATLSAEEIEQVAAALELFARLARY